MTMMMMAFRAPFITRNFLFSFEGDGAPFAKFLGLLLLLRAVEIRK